jgi:hypothetical protein
VGYLEHVMGGEGSLKIEKSLKGCKDEEKDAGEL